MKQKKKNSDLRCFYKTKTFNFFSEITSPNKDTPGFFKTVYSHITNLHQILSDWSSLRVIGAKICKSISALRLHEYEDNYYPYQTKSLINSLLEALYGLENVLEGYYFII